MSIWDRIQYEFNKNSSPIRKLIIINVALFIVTSLISAFARYKGVSSEAGGLLATFYLPSDIMLFLKKPWTLVSYMFLHANLRHIFGNMLLLYFFGRILSDFQSNKSFYTIFFGGGIAGGLLYLLVYNLFPTEFGLSTLRGASGGVIAIVIATAILVPDYEVFLFRTFRLKVKWIALYFVIGDILFFGDGNQGGHLAHIGGAIFGALFMLNSQGRIRLDFYKRIKNPFKPKYTVIDERQILRNRTHKTKEKVAKSASYSVNSSHKPRQEEVDAILDKIGQSGYDSLSSEEKELLFRASE